MAHGLVYDISFKKQKHLRGLPWTHNLTPLVKQMLRLYATLSTMWMITFPGGVVINNAVVKQVDY
jgi:hypothetical protein